MLYHAKVKVCIHYLVKPEKITLLSGNLCLCNLLKFQKGGHFLLSPVQELNKYVAKSNILSEGISLRVLSTSSQVHAACSGQIPLLSKVSVRAVCEWAQTASSLSCKYVTLQP